MTWRIGEGISELREAGGWALVGKMFSPAIAMGSNVVLARVLSPSELGTYFLALSLIAALSIATQMGLNSAVVRLIASSVGIEDSGKAVRDTLTVIVTAFVAIFVVCTVLGIGLWDLIALVPFNSEPLAQVAGPASFLLASTTCLKLLTEVIRGFGDIRFSALLGDIAARLLPLVLVLMVWISGSPLGLSHVMVISAIGATVVALGAGIVVFNKLRILPGNRWNDAEVAVWPILKIAAPLAAVNLSFYALGQVDLWIVGAMASGSDVASYGAAARLAAAVGLPILIANAVLPPVVAEAHAKKEIRSLEEIVRDTATITGLVAVTGALVYLFFGGLVLRLVFGEFYVQANLVLAVLAFGQAVYVLAGSAGTVLMMTGAETVMFEVTSISLLITLLACVVGWNVLGPLGVAGAMTLGRIIQNIFAAVALRNTLGIWSFARFSVSGILGSMRRAAR